MEDFNIDTQNNLILIMGTRKKVSLILGNPKPHISLEYPSRTLYPPFKGTPSLGNTSPYIILVPFHSPFSFPLDFPFLEGKYPWLLASPKP